jgi:hypothetical protein
VRSEALAKPTQKLSPEAASIAAEAARHLEWLRDAGVREL